MTNLTQTAQLFALIRKDLFIYGENLNRHDRFSLSYVVDKAELLINDPRNKEAASVVVSAPGCDHLKKIFDIITHNKYCIEDCIPDLDANIALLTLYREIQLLTAKLIK